MTATIARKANPDPSRKVFPIDRAGLLKAYRIMRTIRVFEERLHEEMSTGDIAGFVHL